MDKLRSFLEESRVNLSRKSSANRAEFINWVMAYVDKLVNPNGSIDKGKDTNDGDRVVRFVGKLPSTSQKGTVSMTQEMSESGG